MRRPRIDYVAPRTGAPIVAALPLRDALEEGIALRAIARPAELVAVTFR